MDVNFIKSNLKSIGKACGLENIWPDLIDHCKPELSACFFSYI